MRDFKKIRAWHRAHALSIALHRLVRGFSRKGNSRLQAQLTNAADSVPANIVEGCGASTKKEFARFLEMSIKSANEAEYHLLSARDKLLISPNDWQRYTAETIEVRKMIYGYRKKLLQGDDEAE